MLTGEQIAIVASEGDVKINAVAGSGKTTTLIEYARARPGHKILYLAFNKTVRLEAEKKFAGQGISNVRVETAHSLAFSRVVRATNYILKNERYKTPDIVELLDLSNYTCTHTDYLMSTHPNQLLS